MRLIDAEKYPCKTCGISYCNENCNKFYEWLNGCDYDVKKVVKQIHEELFCYDIPSEPIEDIVRKGGVD